MNDDSERSSLASDYFYSSLERRALERKVQNDRSCARRSSAVLKMIARATSARALFARAMNERGRSSDERSRGTLERTTLMKSLEDPAISEDPSSTPKGKSKTANRTKMVRLAIFEQRQKKRKK
ncbi:hypothetical protein PRIPAC_91068 [Pristionchus pacificus]|uniref:Uncharacterized protein n=1 Tax=Pristionchus pacificus TaxID=54126 RepID=A0A2A6B3H8_PRIPA|nr:hypothetical protein PRIPAC_91068 [Pristionchus pacificus]|eukprot:PDM60436.1 hypothetical protein PRIPAC_53414 [Pristionchus pacificus]